jgi:hypothetical protein
MAETLVLIEQDHQQVKRPSLHAITLARQLGGEYALLILGYDLDKIARSLVSLGANAVSIRRHEQGEASAYSFICGNRVEVFGHKFGQLSSVIVFCCPAGIPDGGATVMLLGAGLSGLGLMRRFLKR